VTVMEMSKTTLGTEPTARTVQGNKSPTLRFSRALHVRGTTNENQRAECDCKDPNSSFVLPLETLQNRRNCRKRRRSLQFAFSEAKAVCLLSLMLSLLPFQREL